MHRTHWKVRFASSFAVLLLFASGNPARGDVITFQVVSPGPQTFPFGNSDYQGRYQQVYDGALFGPVPFVVREFRFDFLDEGFPEFLGSTVNSSFTMGLSTTSAGPASLSADYGANTGADFAPVFAGTIRAEFTRELFSFVIPLTTPFTYDPSLGNLLLDVFIDQNTMEPTGSVLPFRWGSSPRMGRVFNRAGAGPVATTSSFGLATEVSGNPVPEPTTVLLVASGVAAGALRRWRRRTK